MTWAAFGSGFLLSIVKFMFSAVYLESMHPELNVVEIAFITSSGALFGFNLTFWLSEVILKYSKHRRLEAIKSGKSKRKRAFTRMNKKIVKLKMSEFGLYGLSTLGVLFLSIPLSGIILAKFYGDGKKAYLVATATIIITSFILAILSKFAIGLFR